MDSNARGSLSIWIESPSGRHLEQRLTVSFMDHFINLGMRSQLLHPRPKDNSTEGFEQWPFTSVQFWGESPAGLWKLHIDHLVTFEHLVSPYSLFSENCISQA